MRRSISCVAAALALLAAPPAGAAQTDVHSTNLLTSRLLWATVDVCNSQAEPGVVGIRASMPGTGDGAERMYMRFRLQYRSAAGVWHYVAAGGNSGFIYVGNARFVSRAAGSNFQLAAASGGSPSTFRGIVTFDWRLDGRTLHHAQVTTTAKHPVNQGASPRGYSASRCTIS